MTKETMKQLSTALRVIAGDLIDRGRNVDAQEVDSAAGMLDVELMLAEREKP